MRNFLFILTAFSALIMCCTGCAEKPKPQSKEEVREVNLPLIVIVVEDEAKEDQTGLGRQRKDEPELTTEEERVAKEFAGALKQNKHKDLIKKSLADAPVPMAQIQSSIPLQWSELLDMDRELPEHEVKSPKIHNAKDKDKDGPGYRFIE